MNCCLCVDGALVLVVTGMSFCLLEYDIKYYFIGWLGYFSHLG